jgi:hypothetical protein
VVASVAIGRGWNEKPILVVASSLVVLICLFFWLVAQRRKTLRDRVSVSIAITGAGQDTAFIYPSIIVSGSGETISVRISGLEISEAILRVTDPFLEPPTIDEEPANVSGIVYATTSV